MPLFNVKAPDGTIIPVNAPEGATEQQAIEFAANTWKPQSNQKSNNNYETPSDVIGKFGRQAGLTVRSVLEGGGNLADTLDAPVRYITNTPSGVGSRLSDTLGLPSPNNPVERVVGDTSRALVAGGGSIGLSNKIAGATTGLAQKFAQLLASNPDQQLLSAGAAGAAGGITRENGGDVIDQTIASLGSGITAPLAFSKIPSLINSLKKPDISQIDVKINNLLQPSGLTLSDLPQHVQNGIRSDVQSALNSGASAISPDALRRLTDYRTIGATPTAARLTLDPAMVTQQQNLAKLGINSKDIASQQLGQVENSNNRQLINSLNNLGANTTDAPIGGGQKVIEALIKKNDTNQASIRSLYDTAKATNGRSIELDPHFFTNKANDLLDQDLVGGKLPSDVRGFLNNSATGKMPLTVDVAEQIKRRLGDLQRASIDKSERHALGLVRQALDETPLINDGAGMGQSSIDAFNKARSMNKTWMNIVEKTPALKAVREGIEPDKFVQQFIVGNGSKANVADLKALHDSIKDSPEALMAVREQIAAHLKKQALNGAADEVGNFSQSSYNKALNAIGDDKLSMFFPKEDLQQLKAVGRVASYEQFQPKGSAVNNSNTAGTMMAGILDRIGNSPLLSKLPLGKQVAEPFQNISIGIKSKAALDPNQALIDALREKKSFMVSPSLLMGY